MNPFCRGVLTVCSIVVVGCGFDSDGLASSSNSAGSLESTGAESTGDSVSGGSVESTTTVGTSHTTAASTDDSGPATTSPTTTANPTDTGDTDATATDSNSETAGETSSSASGSAEGSSSEGAATTEDTGAVGDLHYADCGAIEDCGPGAIDCGAYELDDMSTGHVCYVGCDGGNPCPAAGSGTASVECDPYLDACVLDCGGGLICPDGMICDHTYTYNFDRCVWP